MTTSSSWRPAPEVWTLLLRTVAPAAQLVVVRRGEPVLDLADGSLDPSGPTDPVTPDTLFDLASVTKLFTTVAFLRLVDQGEVGLDDPVRDLVPAFGGDAPSAAATTWRQILAHASGLPQIGPLYLELAGEALRSAAVAEPPAGRVGDVLYTDLGPIIQTVAIERLTGIPFEAAVTELVLRPAGLSDVTFRPDPAGEVAPTEWCPWRQRRIRAEVHDKNAFAMGGAAGHAGLFGTARSIAAFGEGLRIGTTSAGALLSPALLAEATREQAADPERRGLGFQLRCPESAVSLTLGPAAYGHHGFTGTSLWIDPDAELVIALLTNWVYGGREDRGFKELSASIHREVVQQWA